MPLEMGAPRAGDLAETGKQQKFSKPDWLTDALLEQHTPASMGDSCNETRLASSWLLTPQHCWCPRHAVLPPGSNPLRGNLGAQQKSCWVLAARRTILQSQPQLQVPTLHGWPLRPPAVAPALGPANQPRISWRGLNPLGYRYSSRKTSVLQVSLPGGQARGFQASQRRWRTTEAQL